MTQTDQLVQEAHAREAAFPGARPAPPARHVAIVTCMDARIDVFRIFGLESGDAHVIRNAGGLATSDVLRSLVISQRALHTREVMLMHHTRCGMHGGDEAALRAQIREHVGGEPPYELGMFADLEAAVRAAVSRVREHPYLKHRDLVRGFVYDVDSGHVHEVT